jgi:hypothetical protein
MTMLASLSFDPRTTWDVRPGRQPEEAPAQPDAAFDMDMNRGGSS